MSSLTAANSGLVKLICGSWRDVSRHPRRERFEAEARANGTDLAGYFNDYKLAFEAGRPRSKNLSPEQVHLDRLLDWLELAEQKGIGNWLAQWNAMMRDPFQRTDISRMADIAESIRAGIEFQKSMVRELDLLEREGIEGPPEAEDVLSLLNSIAYEISRQLGEALVKRFEAGSKLAVARNTLRRNSDRESRAEAVRQAIENLSASGSLAEWSPSPARRNNVSAIIDTVVSDLRQWDGKGDMSSCTVHWHPRLSRANHGDVDRDTSERAGQSRRHHREGCGGYLQHEHYPSWERRDQHLWQGSVAVHPRPDRERHS